MKSVLAIAMITVLFYSCAEDTSGTMENTEDTMMVAPPAEMEQTTTTGQMIPVAVTAAFNNAYPENIIPSWDYDDSLYTASFNNNGLDMAVIYHPDGSRYAIAATIAIEYLPAPVMKVANTLGQIESAKKITMENQSIRYKVMVKGENYFFDENGAMIQEQAAKENIQKAL